eukprot:scaffold67053_cov35-Tisochrysis_lutea.AAC.1
MVSRRHSPCERSPGNRDSMAGSVTHQHIFAGLQRAALLRAHLPDPGCPLRASWLCSRLYLARLPNHVPLPLSGRWDLCCGKRLRATRDVTVPRALMLDSLSHMGMPRALIRA